jgi:hypothetical protein
MISMIRPSLCQLRSQDSTGQEFPNLLEREHSAALMDLLIGWEGIS